MNSIIRSILVFLFFSLSGNALAADSATTDKNRIIITESKKQEISHMIQSMTPGNLSTLRAVLQQDGNAQIGTIRGSANDDFYSDLEKSGLAIEKYPDTKGMKPETLAFLERAKFFSLTPEGKKLLLQLVPAGPKEKVLTLTPSTLKELHERHESGN